MVGDRPRLMERIIERQMEAVKHLEDTTAESHQDIEAALTTLDTLPSIPTGSTITYGTNGLFGLYLLE